jgi:pimeloyl-ACP methyl ester carboxylesterase
VVPGLGALGYLLPTVQPCSAWTRVHLLDVPGFGHRATARCPASLADVARAVTDWLDAVPDRPVLLVGHSTGAQAALHAALAVPERVTVLSLAGPTFPPEARRWRPLAARVARTARHERLGLLPATVAATPSACARSASYPPGSVRGRPPRCSRPYGRQGEDRPSARPVAPPFYGAGRRPKGVLPP